jgi:gamma-glutamyltranspeptidase/glutathione hydrolase
MEFDGQDITEAIDAPRWRSEDGSLLIEVGHLAAQALESRGHTLNQQQYGDPIFGAVVAAGYGPRGLTVGADSRRGVVGRIE